MKNTKEYDRAYYLKNKEAKKAASKKYYQENKAEVDAQHKRYYLDNQEAISSYKKEWHLQRRFLDAIQTAARKKKEFTLTEDEYNSEIAKPCYYCQDLFGKDKGFGIGLDRIDNSIGYLPGNVVSCCKCCNLTRGDRFTQQETKAAVEAILKLRGLL